MRWKGITSICRIAALFLAVSIIGCSLRKDREIVVSAAISLKDAFEEIGSIYETRSGIRVRLNLGASGLLQKQIEAGAPADVFAGAGEKQMDELQARGLILADTRHNLVRNSLVLIVPAGSPFPIRSFEELARPEIKRVAIGNPKTVPAGQYASQALKNLKLWSRLEARLVLAENVRQVLDYVVRGEVEAGIVYGSDISIAHGKVTVAASAPEDSHDPILYPIAVIDATRYASKARNFIDLALSRTGQEILSKYGFIPLR